MVRTVRRKTSCMALSQIMALVFLNNFSTRTLHLSCINVTEQHIHSIFHQRSHENNYFHDIRSSQINLTSQYCN